jgi:hypothetical protein
MTDAFKRMNNPEIEKMKSASIMATNLGPGVPQVAMDTFRLLKNDPIKLIQLANKQNDIKDSLAKQVDVLVKQRDEFQN